ncbi:hypothetical protein E0H93_26490 [Rhizobium leguminosarum bv. viciae]|uniref:hypothetical protein n=1 Tax=Rhizobium leguminosarum TaxID=384 RepID=UPI00103D8B8A|nr:hypothetical protein [Rhizobium leguminosarum]MBY5493239.1 hypothetical protein [Rhizobium leguminosarum]MBY5526187.1 hypothetical protein [Rhizobium leguminosarum]TBY30144.1 hypothetical protein E0H55_21945 [Rhizobium leguminosarum bv. viciae]TBY35288.1 hypothetical protein E0H60_24445 [Rhizobium leguminosarum bv. viciae]TCB01007.1 hypothetical protein E0H93_26490 [Rhizobium leguminosarum bv. viciae]
MAVGSVAMGRKKKEEDQRTTTIDATTLQFPAMPSGVAKNQLLDEEREALTIEAFVRKLQFMEYLFNRRLRGDLPKDEYWPRNISEFHAWENIELGIYRLGTKSNVSPDGKYATYVEEFHRKKAQLERAFRDELASYREQNGALSKTNAALAQQNAQLLYQIQLLCDDLFLATGRRVNLVELLDEGRRR